MKQRFPTYIINLEKRVDRRLFIESEFSAYPRFDIHIVPATENSVPAVGLYQSLFNIVLQAKEAQLKFVVVCEDDHCFTEYYDDLIFDEYLVRMDRCGADMLLGGVSWFEQSVKFTKDLYWVNTFTGTQFLVIFDRFYDRILNTPFQQNNIIDRWMAGMSDKIFVTVPMFSLQKDFGYSDVTARNKIPGRVDELFLNTIMRWKALQEIDLHIKKRRISSTLISSNDYTEMQISTYIVYGNDRLYESFQIEKQFVDRKEFIIKNIAYEDDGNELLCHWKAFQSVIKSALNDDEDVILICEADHIFTKGYDKQVLFDCIFQAAHLGADIILGGVTQSPQSIMVDDNLCWIDSFRSSQFILVFRDFFQVLLETSIDETESFDVKLSNLTGNKYVIHPFISSKQEQGLAKNGVRQATNNQDLNEEFESSSSKLSMVRLKTRQFCAELSVKYNDFL
ncbi:hypothetical protein [Sphingobacterium sp.]|uniref:hypothetical protein n=1 Tax=Sphingobacterium sp. TaxID=341027 RepID=UPI00289B1BDE|nr:hypothetical protein [Sphingobacterium sp.]